MFSLVALLLPLVALGAMAKGPGDTAHGRSRAAWRTAARVVGLLCAVALLLWSAGVAMYRGAKHKRDWTYCIGNMKILSHALVMYREDSDGFFPPAETWYDSLMPYVKNEHVFRCPAGPDIDYGHAMNSALSGVRLGDDAATTSIVAVFESDAGWNAHGGPSLLPPEPRRNHSGLILGDHYVFADGHTGWLPRKWRGTEENKVWLKEPDGDVVWEPAMREEKGGQVIQSD